MCITAADIKSAEESIAWDSLCPECSNKAERLLDERKDSCLLDIPMEEYNFCPECVVRINKRFDEFYA